MNIDETYMSRALQLAKNGFGRESNFGKEATDGAES